MKNLVLVSLILAAAAPAAGETICKGTVTLTKISNQAEVQKELTVTILPGVGSLGKTRDTGLQMDFGFGVLSYSGPIDPLGAHQQFLKDAHADANIGFYLKVEDSHNIDFKARLLDADGNVEAYLKPATLTCE